MWPPPPSSSPSPLRTGPTLDWEEALDLLRTMWLIRAFEESAGELERGGEAVAAGRLQAAERRRRGLLRPARVRARRWRPGCSLAATMAELMGRVGGLCKGLGGPGHLVDVEHGLMGSTGGNPAVAAGSALAAKLRGDDQVVVAFLDESEAHGGRFAETIALAALWGLPVIFVCENGGGRFVSDAVAHHGVPTQTRRRQRRGGGLGVVRAPARVRARGSRTAPARVPRRAGRERARGHDPPLPAARRRRGLVRRRRRRLDRAGVATGGRGGRPVRARQPGPDGGALRAA